MSMLFYHFKELPECIREVERIEAKVNNSKKNKKIDEHFQKSTLTIMHCQHVKGFSLVLANFSFLPHILQQRPTTICRCCSLILFFKSILLFAAAVIPSRQAPQTTYRIHGHLYCSLIESSFAK
jgi:hypothetical protein